MRRGKLLDEHEKSLIIALSEGSRTDRDIAARLERSKNVVATFLRAPASYGNEKPEEGHKSILPLTKVKLFREVSNELKAPKFFARS